MPKPSRLSSPATTKRPKTRRDAAMPHYNEPVSIAQSLFLNLRNMRRCIVARDGKTVSDSRKWVEILRNTTAMFEDTDGGEAIIATEDGRRWSVTIREVRS